MENYSITKVPSQIRMELAKKFRDLRKHKKYSQQEMASRSGVSLGSLKRFEQTGQISLASLLQLAHLFDRLEDFDLVFKMDENLDLVKKLFSK
jgi:transcriptional regulator with XRE-family HTH domain